MEHVLITDDGSIVPTAPIGVVLPIFSTNKYRVSGPIDFYIGSTTPIGAIGTICSTTPIGGIGIIAPTGVVLPLNCSTTPIQ
jgi:hypothetical protein